MFLFDRDLITTRITVLAHFGKRLYTIKLVLREFPVIFELFNFELGRNKFLLTSDELSHNRIGWLNTAIYQHDKM